MIRVHDHGGIRQTALVVIFQDGLQVFVVVVGHARAEVVHIPPQDRVGQDIARGLHFPAVEEEVLPVLRRLNGVHHDRQVAAGGILHPHGDSRPGRDHAVQLVFDAAGSDGAVAEQVLQVPVVFRIKDFLGAGKARLLDDVDVHAADGLNAQEHVFLAFRVGLVQHSLVPYANGTRLVRVHAGDDEQRVPHGLLHLGEARHVFQHGRLVVGGARADNQQKAVVLAR